MLLRAGARLGAEGGGGVQHTDTGRHGQLRLGNEAVRQPIRLKITNGPAFGHRGV
jgi:hypothetical protein